MSLTKRVLGFVFVLSAAAVADARAQGGPWEDMVFININGAAQNQSREFETANQFTLYDEPATITTSQKVGGGGLFDIGGGVRVWGNLAVGIAVSRFSDKGAAEISATLPNPLFIDLPRTATASAPDLEHSENAVHLQVLWFLPLTDKIDVAFSAGPSFFRVRQGLVSDVQTTEGAFPFTTVTISGVSTTEAKANATGYNVGVDATYMVTDRVGGGFFVRYTGASVNLPLQGGDELPLDVGGTQVGGGLRVRF